MEQLPPDLSPISDSIYDVIREWFPDTPTEECEELAFAIVHDVLHAVHVEGELWSVTIDRASSR